MKVHILLSLLLAMSCRKNESPRIEFHVEVPATTPTDEFIYLKVHGNRAFRMIQTADYTYSFVFETDPNTSVYYAYQRGDVGEQTVESTAVDPAGGAWDQLRLAETNESKRVIHDTVGSWRWLEDEVPEAPPSLASSSEFLERVEGLKFQGGIGMHDYYSPGFLELTDRAARRQRANHMKWVNLAVNAWVTQNNAESFSIDYEPDGQYDEVSLREQIRIFRSHGIEVKLTAGLQNEGVPEGMTEIYWDRRFQSWMNYLKWLGALAQEEGVGELTLIGNPALPGEGQAPASNTDRWLQMMTQLRALFKGTISYSLYLGTTFDSLHPLDKFEPIASAFDTVGVFMWDPITTEDNPSVDKLQVALAAQFDKYLLSFWQTYQKPVYIEQLAYASVEKGYLGSSLYPADDRKTSTFLPPDPAVKTDLMIQARIFEAVMREVAARPYITGVFAFGQPYWKSIDRNYGVWGKPAEVILSNWYARAP